MDEFTLRFLHFRTGTVVLSAGQNIGDLLIFIGRHDTIQHSCILVWLDKNAMLNHQIKIHPRYIDEETTVLSFLGLAEGGRNDMITGDKQKGLILWDPEDLFENAPIVYTRSLSEKYISDDYVTEKMQEYIELNHLKMQYAYGKLHIVTVGLGFDVFGRHKKNGKLCSENIFLFLNHLCEYPNFKVDGVTEYPDYKVPDAEDYLYVPDFFLSNYNTHPVFEEEEYRVISKKNEEEITVLHPFFLVFAILVIIIIFTFLLVNNFCESCNAKSDGICPINSKDIFDLI